MEDGITLSGVLITTAILSVGVVIPLLLWVSKPDTLFQRILGYIWMGLVASFLLIGAVAAYLGGGTPRQTKFETDWDRCVSQFESRYDCYEWGERPFLDD